MGNEQYKGDGNCDDGNNNEGCDFDGGDCCDSTHPKGKIKTKFCTECKCLDPKGQGPPPAKCKNEKFKGDGNCDDGNNNEGCEFDGGDCCAKTAKSGAVKTKFCTECECLDPNGQGAAEEKCQSEKYKRDGNCDDGNNNAACEFDGGDCCEKTNIKGQVKTKFCKECKCLDPNGQGEAAPKCKNEKFKGDGNCDDGNNNEGCAFDGGDCCEKTNIKGQVRTKF